MANRLFLYMDILGFKNLINSDFNIKLIYDRIDKLLVHRDDGFTCIVFSDTIIVYANDGWEKYGNADLMYLIEFYKELFYRMISLDIHIRGYVTIGDFEHHRMKNIEAYYGSVLVDCYKKEKNIKCTGLFIDNAIVHRCDVFNTTPYNDDCHYVHVMQDLEYMDGIWGGFPIPGEVVEERDVEWFLAYALFYLKNIHHHANDLSLPEDARTKHKNAWRMISSKYPVFTDVLESSGFDFSAVVNLDWKEPIRRIGTDDGAWG